MDGFDAVFVSPFLDFQIEAGVVDADDGVGMPAKDVAFAETDVAQHGTEMAHHLDESHDGEVADMTYRLAGLFHHSVAAPKAEFRLRVFHAQSLYEIGSVEIARGFAGYDVVSHFC